jgi:hypothetical protein
VQIGPRPFNPRWLDPDEVVAQTKRYLEWRARERQRRRAYLLKKAKQEGRNVDAAAKAIDAENETEAALDEEHLEHVQERVRKELKAREHAMSRFYVLLSAQLLIIGPVKNAVGVESFRRAHQLLAASRRRDGDHPRLAQDPRRLVHGAIALLATRREGEMARHRRLRPETVPLDRVRALRRRHGVARRRRPRRRKELLRLERQRRSVALSARQVPAVPITLPSPAARQAASRSCHARHLRKAIGAPPI